MGESSIVIKPCRGIGKCIRLIISLDLPLIKWDLRSGGEDTKQLGKGSEWSRILELNVQTADILEILSERSIVVWVVPIPSRDTLVVVLQDPT
jgi:hypothetical protein